MYTLIVEKDSQIAEKQKRKFHIRKDCDLQTVPNLIGVSFVFFCGDEIDTKRKGSL